MFLVLLRPLQLDLPDISGVPGRDITTILRRDFVIDVPVIRPSFALVDSLTLDEELR